MHQQEPLTPDAPLPQDPLAWWREARFGMFIHWGLYCVPAGIWKGREMPGIGEWIMAHFNIPLAEYRELAKLFNPTDFDARFIANLARDAGMKYLVITAKHHEGFAMWDSKVSDYNIVKATPFGRDPLKELAQACRDAGIRLCFYYSQDLDWEHPDGGLHGKDTMGGRNLGRYIEEKVKPQLRELLTQYGPIGLIWCDTPANITPEQSRDIKAFIKSIQPDCLVSGRVGHDVGDYGSMGDNQIPLGQVKGDWETPATLNDTWGFKLNDHHWKSTGTLLRLLIDLSSKGVNYLLNIGPDSLGRVPQPSVERLRAIGGWLKVNGAALYGTSASPFPYEQSWGRITRKDNCLNLIFYSCPRQPFTLYGLRSRIVGARLLDGGRTIPVRQETDVQAEFLLTTLQFDDAMDATMTPALKDLPIVVVLTFEKTPEIAPGLYQQHDGSVSLFAHMSEPHRQGTQETTTTTGHSGATVAIEAERANSTPEARGLGISRSGLLHQWISTEDYVSWTFDVLRPTRFRLQVNTVANKHETWLGGHRMSIRVNGHEAVRDIVADDVFESPRTHLFAERITHFGEVDLPAGRHTLELRTEFIHPDVRGGICCSGVFLINQGS